MNSIKLTLTLIALAVLGVEARAQKVELRWGEFGCYSIWNRPSYAIKSEFEFVGRLPDLREFPKLLTAALDPKMNNSDRALIFSQMRALSRCEFDKLLLDEGDDFEAEHSKAVSRWQQWWDAYGSKLPNALEERGKRYKDAWSQVAPTPYLDCPAYPVLIPTVWSSTISFRSGDYGGVTEEVIEFHVKESSATLKRRYRSGWPGRAPWTYEEWQGFSSEEAVHFLACLIYSIDNPWFYASDQLAQTNDKDKRVRITHLRGRPEAWTTYQARCKWTGILDVDGRVIINHDPWHWNSFDHEMGPKTKLDEGSFGVVFRLVRDLFPDPSWNPEDNRWKRIEPPMKERQPEVPDAAKGDN